MNGNYDFQACIGLKVKPRKGDGLLFWSLTPNGSYDKVPKSIFVFHFLQNFKGGEFTLFRSFSLQRGATNGGECYHSPVPHEKRVFFGVLGLSRFKLRILHWARALPRQLSML
jgi:hypothetical protein